MLWKISTALFSLLLSACSTVVFTHPAAKDKPNAEIAIIEGSYRLYPFLLLNFATWEEFYSVDGERVYSAGTIRLVPGPHWLEFGHKTIVVAAGYGGGGGGELPGTLRCLLQQDLKAGYRYKIKSHSLEARNVECLTSSSNLCDALLSLEISSPDGADRLAQATVTCLKAPQGSTRFCKTDQHCSNMFVRDEGLNLLDRGSLMQGRCMPQAGYDFGLCETTQQKADN